MGDRRKHVSECRTNVSTLSRTCPTDLPTYTCGLGLVLGLGPPGSDIPGKTRREGSVKSNKKYGRFGRGLCKHIISTQHKTQVPIGATIEQVDNRVSAPVVFGTSRSGGPIHPLTLTIACRVVEIWDVFANRVCLCYLWDSRCKGRVGNVSKKFCQNRRNFTNVSPLIT